MFQNVYHLQITLTILLFDYHLDRILPICLPIDEEIRHRDFVGKTPFLAGFGLTKEGGRQPTQLMQVQLPVLENRECYKMYRIITPFNVKVEFKNNTLCAGYLRGGKGSCYGDSGGPFMLPIDQNGTFNFYQIGVVTGSEGCAEPNIPVIFANVAYYVDWIQKKVLE